MQRSPARGLFAKARAHAAGRLAAARRKAPEELDPLLAHLEKDFCDADLTVDQLERLGLADWRQRDRFRQSFGMPIKKYLLRLKRNMAEWLLSHSDVAVQHIARILHYPNAANFSRDFTAWTGKSPRAYRDAARPRLGGGGRRHEQRVKVGSHLTGRLTLRRPAGSRTKRSGGLRAFLGGAGAEEEAREIWELVRLETQDRARQLLLREVLFATPELFELLSRLSREQGRRNRRRGVELAELALAAVEGSALVLDKLYGDLQVLAYARLGNALRLAGEFKAANAAFQRAEELWAPREGRGDKRVAAELWDLKAALRLFEGRFNAALELLRRALSIACQLGDVDRQITVLGQRAAIKRHQGMPAEMLRDLDKVEELILENPQPDRNLLLGVYQEKALAYLEAERDADARRYLARARELCHGIDDPKSREQLRWIGAQLAARAGDLRETEGSLRLSRAGLFEIGDWITGGMAALDLAIFCHGQRRFPEVTSLVVADVLPTLEKIQQRPEARVALDLLRRSIAAESISIATLRHARAALRDAQVDPSFQVPLPA